MKKMIQFVQQYHELITYLFWGVMTTLVSWATYSIFTILLQDVDYIIFLLGVQISPAVLISNVLSWICAVLFAFITNKMWVFQSKEWKKQVWIPELGKFVSARVVTGILEMVAVPLLVGMGLNQTILGIEGMVAKVIVSVVVVLLNYVFSKLFIFK